MDQVFNFDKSLQQRLREYKDVFEGFEILPASALMKEWGFYLELTMDQNGWQAVWKISRTTCDLLKIPFPTIVLVFVLDVDFSSLQALIRVIAVQDEIHIPEKHRVPLIQLWPTKAQDKTVALNLSSTANVVDMLRFFYIHLFMPWDLDEDDTVDWRSKHLESRLRLYYDMKNGVIPKATALRLNSLLTEARRMQQNREVIEVELEEFAVDEDSNQGHIEELTNIHLRLTEIKSEVEILENPLLRKALFRRQNQVQVDDIKDVKEPRIWLIQEENSKVDNYIKFLEQVKTLYPNEAVTLVPNLCETLENGGPNDSFILSEGKYELNVKTAFENGGILKGIGDRAKIVLVSMLDDIMLDFQVDHCLIENVTLDASQSQCAAVIRKGKVTFSNCVMIGDGVSTTHQGIIVLAGAELELINCVMYGFYTALVGNSGSKITMQNTEIHHVHYGLKIYDNSLINVHKCTFRNCQDYGVCVETESNLEGGSHKVGDFDVLNVIPQVTTEFVNGMNNGKGDVLINRTSQINAIEDLFSKFDPTASGEPSDEDVHIEDSGSQNMESEEFDNTVIQRDENMSPATI